MICIVAAVFLTFPVVLGAPLRQSGPYISPRVDSIWEKFNKARPDMLMQLAEPIEDCWSRNATFFPDNASPMFHSCVDWHSSVHAAYSLYAITQASGNDRYKDIAEAVVHNDKVSAEIEFMEAAGLFGVPFVDFEVPYGMAWMFNLVMQRKTTTGNDGLRLLGDFAARQLRAYLASLSDQDMRKLILVPSHYNLSWALIHLARWAKYIADEGMRQEVEQRFLSVAMDPSWDETCPAVSDSTSDYVEFFPPCLMRIAAVIQMWNETAGSLQSWVYERVPPNFTIPPVTEIEDERSGHKFAINFSRAYALWYIYEATGNLDFRDNYAQLITYQISRPDFWNIEAGYKASHFVPQFGVRAIEASKDRVGVL